MNMCAITGATGLVGSACADEFTAQGYKVLALQRSTSEQKTLWFDLAKPSLQPADLTGVEVLVHCAYDFQAHGWEEVRRINVGGSIHLFETALKAGVSKIIFISSISAFPGCRSIYGQCKLEVEDFVLRSGGLVIRPGLIYGKEGQGMFATLKRLSRFRVLPVFDGGRQRLHLIHVRDLAAAICLQARSWRPSPPVLTLGDPNGTEFRQLLGAFAAEKKRKISFFSVPSGLALMGLRLIEGVGVRLGFRADNLVGLVHGNPTPEFSDLEALLPPAPGNNRRF